MDDPYCVCYKCSKSYTKRNYNCFCYPCSGGCGKIICHGCSQKCNIRINDSDFTFLCGECMLRLYPCARNEKRALRM